MFPVPYLVQGRSHLYNPYTNEIFFANTLYIYLQIPFYFVVMNLFNWLKYHSLSSYIIKCIPLFEYCKLAVFKFLYCSSMAGFTFLKYSCNKIKVGHLIFLDRKSTRLNSSHVKISYAVFC